MIKFLGISTKKKSSSLKISRFSFFLFVINESIYENQRKFKTDPVKKGIPPNYPREK